MRLRSYFAGYVAATMLAAGSALAQDISESKPHAGTDLGQQAPSGKSFDNYGWGGAGIWYKRPDFPAPLPAQTNQCHHGIPYDFKLDTQRGVATKDFQGCQRDERGPPPRTFNCRELDNEIANLDRDIQHMEDELETTPPGDKVDAFGMGAITTVPRSEAEEYLRAFRTNRQNAYKALRKMQQDPHNRFGCTPTS